MITENKFEISEIDNVFNIENVTIEFFNEYKRLFLDLTDSLNDVKSRDKEVYDEFENKKIESSDFAKKLMGQLVFVYFLQKKGWLGCNYDEEWGKGPKNFLRKLFDKNYGDYKNFFNDILEPLFYQGFCEPVMDYHFSQFKFKVPFLNGGLFEPMNNYDWIRTDLSLDDSIFKEILDKSNTIIWNGPVGKFEMEDYSNGTKELCEIIKDKEITIIGGGDTASAVINLGYKDAFTHISTGGGASLEMLEGKVLPGVAAITDK